MIKDLLGKMINDCLYLHDSNEGIGIEAVKDDVSSQIYKELKRCVPAKEEITDFQMECQNIPVCKGCGNYYGEVHDKLIINKKLDQFHKNLKKACGE